jgi:diaminopimelate epimerase
MNMDFVKYQGLGNDFILVHLNDYSADSKLSEYMTGEEAQRICNRNYGVGADGIIFALPGSNGCDYNMRMYNSDGTEPQMCGNGIRCMAKFLQDVEDRSGIGTSLCVFSSSHYFYSLASGTSPYPVRPCPPLSH